MSRDERSQAAIDGAERYVATLDRRKGRKTKEQRQREAAITKAYTLAFNGVPVNMLDIPTIYREIEAAIVATLQTGGTPKTLAARLAELRQQYGRA